MKASRSPSHDSSGGRSDANSLEPTAVELLLETLDQHVNDRLDSIERQIANLGQRMEGAGKFVSVHGTPSSDVPIRACLGRLSEAEATLAGVRSVLTRVLPSAPGYASLQSMLHENDVTLAACRQVPLKCDGGALSGAKHSSKAVGSPAVGADCVLVAVLDEGSKMDAANMLVACEGDIDSKAAELCADYRPDISRSATSIGDDLRVNNQAVQDKLEDKLAQMELRASQSPEEWVQHMGCKTVAVKRYVEKELFEAASCLSMPLVFAMFILYVVSVMLHQGFEQLHSVDLAINFDIKENANFAYGGDVPFENGRMGHKNIYDVNSFADFWSWLDLGIVPIFWAEDWELSEVRSNVYSRCMFAKEAYELYGWQSSSFPNGSSGLRPGMMTGNAANPYFCAEDQLPPRPKEFYDNDRAGVYLYYNSVVAGVRLRQERSTPDDCPNPDSDLRRSLHKGQCLPSSGYFLKPERLTSFGVRKSLADKKGGETKYLESRKSQSAIRTELHNLEDALWLSPETAKVEMLFTLYNPHLDIFSATFILIFMNRGGHMYKLVEPVSTHLTQYRNPLSYVVDSLLLLLVLKILFGEAVEVYKGCRSKGCQEGLREYMSPANFVDWSSVIYFFALMGYWLAHTKLVISLGESMRPASIEVAGSFSDVSDRDNFYDLVDRWVASDSVLRTIMAIFPFIIGARFFKVFSLQPRLGVVTATLRASFVDIFHFFIVFAAIFGVFVIAAMIVFGQEIDDFTTLARSTLTVFRMMMGDFDFEEMIRVSRPQAFFWYWSFTWLVNLVMLNMLLAIVMDVYTEVKGNIASEAETMWSQVIEIAHRMHDVRRGHQIPLEKILEGLELYCPDEKSDNRLTVQDLMRIVPDVPEHQAMHLLVAVYLHDEETNMGGGTSMTETSATVQHIFKYTQLLNSSMERLIHMQEASSEMVSNNFAALKDLKAQTHPRRHKDSAKQ